MGNHRIVQRIGVFLDVQILLDDAARIGEKGPLGAQRIAELVGLHQLVGGDGHDPRVADLELRVEIDQVSQLPAILGAVMPPRQDEDHGILRLEFRQFATRSCLVR